MWILKNGELTQVEDETRIKFRTNISWSLLHELGEMAQEYDTRINYLIETGLEKLLEDDYIAFDKKARPKDRVQYKTTYDHDLLVRTKKFAANHGLFINDVIEYSCKFIDPDKSKNADHRYRIER